jgi:hypothetical protein
MLRRGDTAIIGSVAAGDVLSSSTRPSNNWRDVQVVLLKRRMMCRAAWWRCCTLDHHELRVAETALVLQRRGTERDAEVAETMME